jgi:hypothetical protein
MDNGYSPWLSALTATIEIAAGVWALRSPGRRRVRIPVALLQFVLAGYQVAEIFICAAPERTTLARLAFVDVVWLPPLALTLLVGLADAGRLARGAVKGAWAIAGGLAVWMAVDPSFVVGTVCQAVLATYQHGTPFHHAFGGFYELCLGAIVFGGAAAMARVDDRVDRAHIADLQMGVLGFMVPAMLTQIIWKGLDPSLPSIMCHYALVLALLLVRITRREARAARGLSATRPQQLRAAPAR